MLSRLFRAHGQMCASRPWEVIFGMITFTVCVMSMSVFATSHKICGYNYKCTQQDYDGVSQSLYFFVKSFYFKASRPQTLQVVT